MTIGERIAKVIAPEAVRLAGDYRSRLLEENKRLKKLTEFQKREIKRLRAELRRHSMNKEQE